MKAPPQVRNTIIDCLEDLGIESEFAFEKPESDKMPCFRFLISVPGYSRPFVETVYPKPSLSDEVVDRSLDAITEWLRANVPTAVVQMETTIQVEGEFEND